MGGSQRQVQTNACCCWSHVASALAAEERSQVREREVPKRTSRSQEVWECGQTDSDDRRPSYVAKSTTGREHLTRKRLNHKHGSIVLDPSGSIYPDPFLLTPNGPHLTPVGNYKAFPACLLACGSFNRSEGEIPVLFPNANSLLRSSKKMDRNVEVKSPDGVKTFDL